MSQKRKTKVQFLPLHSPILMFEKLITKLILTV
jgi:hypothetical protein